MGKVSQTFCIMKNIFWEESQDKRVLMGFILGIALFGYWLNFFLQYVWDTGEPVNILEAFIVIEHHYKNMLFLVLGWLLLMSDAPFLKGNCYLILYRSGRKRWNVGMLLYIMFQAFVYVTCIAAVSVIATSFWGFLGKMWSSPVYRLAMDRGNDLGLAYNITFPWENIMRNLTVPQAFGITFLFMWLYLVFLGILLYVCNLFLKGIYGILIVFSLQLLGYLQQQDGLGNISLMAKAMPGYSIDGAGGQWKTVLLFIGIIGALIWISLRLVEYVEFRDVVEDR